ncbi:unnamed protein product [Peronospora farinosa]|uniref:Peptidase C1A papain C-terminal domain-containing protein n=1 Tax=Peronospora farinosa TaxID=134698 RepID=A0AAV0U2Q5_9STRA|nr:unnamed protein product [Peronospora farinosa]CAI5729248.1 unnamed protein product [Peronospora farinosa]
MQPRVSTKTVVLALAIMMVWIDNFVDARPMHADIIPTYLQYLEEKEQVAAELEKWLKVYGPNGTKKGFMPVTESRSGDQKEDLQQRLFMTKNQIKKAQKANPHAVLGTQGPFTLMTMEEFHEFLSNSHVAQAHKPEPPLSKNTSTNTSNNGDFDNEDVENEGTSPTKRLPATTASTPIAATRLLRNVEKSDLTFDVGDNNEEMGFESIADSETVHQSQKPYQRSTTTATNRNWNFEDVSTGDKAQIAQVSDAETLYFESTYAPASDLQSTSVSSENPPSGISRYQRTEPCSGNDCQAPATQALIYSMLTPASPALAPASVPVEESSMAVRDSDSDSIDWSTSVCVSDPGLQGQCSSDWAFATVAALEAAQCIYNGNKKAPTYSKQQLVSCDKKNFGCNGGAPVYAMEYVRDNGICLESSYEYTSKEGGQAAACLTSCTPTKSEITEIGAIESGDESALLSVVKQQPVIVSVISSNPAWKQYISGVITACPTAEVDHAVLVVGYDAHTIKIKNSWGTDWGENGYVRISRSSQNMGTCAVLTDMSYPIL